MSAPNEPGFPRAGENSGGGNGSTGRVGTEGGDVPPWQRGRPNRPPQGHPQEGPARPEPGRTAAPTQAPGAEARNTSRFPVSGSAPTEETRAPRPPERSEAPRPDAPRQDPPRQEAPRPEAYASELPDLSGPRPQRKPDRPATESQSRPAARTQVGQRPARGPVRASMQIRRVDPWSALKVSLVLSVALFFVWMIAVAFLYLVLGGMGVWSKLNSNVGDLLTSASGSSGGELVSSGTIFGGAALIGLVNIVILTAMATAGAFIYNLTTDLVGGVEVTLADRD
ncbi:DUF3566 domain-containing protein [Mycobacterium sp. GA-2829]|uniref:DUF3566 domain-containing protein n=1 Tax=Mycobacterium sp. GA-2829 TaxID=1772283 RepID=UPI00073FF6EF|nr:DUF3566 domain-containing protein [Mycobacterium sp. GA-2829]KUI27743.1 hypothetical protein AU194_21845 [Mycobacterium sp. GA-2829]